jgi:hypothetical protein
MRIRVIFAIRVTAFRVAGMQVEAAFLIRRAAGRPAAGVGTARRSVTSSAWNVSHAKAVVATVPPALESLDAPPVLMTAPSAGDASAPAASCIELAEFARQGAAEDRIEASD